MFERILLAALAVVVLVVSAPEAQGKSGFPITACGQTVTTNAVLTQDLTCTESGIVVGAPGITIDLGGHTLTGNHSGSHYGVDDTGGYDKVTVKHGALSSFDEGIRAEGADFFSVANVVVSKSLGIGIVVGGGSAAVASSLVTGNWQGIFVLGNDASVRSTSALGNQTTGVAIAGDHASIQAVTASGNNRGIHISGNQGSVRSSTASGSAEDGILYVGGGASVQASTAAGNGAFGIFVTGDAPRVTGNHADGNGYAAGATDGIGFGVIATNYTTPPVGTNSALGNDNPAECSPAPLC